MTGEVVMIQDGGVNATASTTLGPGLESGRGETEASGFSAFPAWQILVILGLISWVYVARLSFLTIRLRSVLQPLVVRHVERSVPFLLWLQGVQNPTLDAVLASLSYSVSVEFYTTFLPLVFWSGHSKLARNITLLMALCIYLGNCLKDVVSAPRPPSPPVRKLLATHAEEESSQEYGLPSSHTINSLCLAGFILYYLGEKNFPNFWLVFALVGVVIFGVTYGRLYLGMHSPLDVIVGAGMGFSILALWCSVVKDVDEFVVRGENVLSFWGTMAVLLIFAYPSPERQNPSFEFHTAFNGVAFGVVSGVHRTYALYHHDGLQPLPLTSLSGLWALLLRLAVGLPLCLTVKALSKELAIRTLPGMCNLLGLEIRSSGYVKALHAEDMSFKQMKHIDGELQHITEPAVSESRSSKSGFFPKFLLGVNGELLDVDTGIRALQYAGLGWAVVELAPQLYAHLNL